ncbi:hypothetical protein [Myxococcus qinghaiensis]|uniref:hypothetical protein n=1 Tax=Myxococcus qinghaiensis TaxID=2906758 RepID=UPI0020A80374|nr:hypothetical protein [Myxococcus qinghaiensis]MCP3162110.1 hypothetical protein [Myxococcus qinghaiensis]
MRPFPKFRSPLLAVLAGTLTLGTASLAGEPLLTKAGTPIHPANEEGLRRAEAEAAVAAAIPPHPPPVCPGVIDNGTVRLGVASAGHLTVACTTSTVSSGTSGTTDVGLRYLPTNAEAAAPGTPCEGWGVASADLGITGHTSAGCGAANVTVESFTATTTTAMSVVRVGTTFRVTHRYVPSPATPFLYQVDVLIENMGTAPVTDLRYTRGIDYDVLPNTFSEFVSFAGATAPSVLSVSNNGFTSLDPLAVHPTLPTGTPTFVDLGPGDMGSHFDFQLGALAPGRVLSFRMFYGAAGTEPAALGALAAVGVGTYSLGQGNWNGSGSPLSPTGAPAGTFGASSGQPTTFMFGFLPPPPPSRCTVGCRIFNPNEIYTVDLLGTQDICLVNGSSYIVPVGVLYRYGQRIEFNCGNYGPPFGTLCNVIPGPDTCNAAVYDAICSSPLYAQSCLP